SVRPLAVIRKAPLRQLVLSAMVLAVTTGSAAPSVSPVSSATVPMRVSNNRIFVPVRVQGRTGRSVAARFWVDSGGDSIILSGRLSHELGLSPTGRPSLGMSETPLQPVTKPDISIGAVRFDLRDVNVFAAGTTTDRNAFAGIEADGFLPATVLKKYEVVFDYPK